MPADFGSHVVPDALGVSGAIVCNGVDRRDEARGSTRDCTRASDTRTRAPRRMCTQPRARAGIEGARRIEKVLGASGLALTARQELNLLVARSMGKLARSKTIVLVDDDEDLRFTIALSLRDAGFEVDEYESADEALPKVTASPPAAIFLDYRIDGMSAPAFVEALRAGALGDVPVVLLTGSQNIGDLAKEMDVFDALPKPFELDELVRRAKAASEANR
jgi:CheY-like chemotaxis protein